MHSISRTHQTLFLCAGTLAIGVGAGAMLRSGAAAPPQTKTAAHASPDKGPDKSCDKTLQTGLALARDGGCTMSVAATAQTREGTVPDSVAQSIPEVGPDAGTKAFVSGDYAFAPAPDAPQASDAAVTQLKGKLMPSVESLRDALSLPPLPEGCTDLRMNEFFEKPGDFGMQYTAKVKSLDGKKVRLLGFMVNRCAHSPGMFLLTSMPVTTHEHEMGLADDLPLATVHVFTPQSPTIEGDTPRTRRLGVVPASHQYGELLPGSVPWTPGLLLLTGTLRTGTREEADGRVSVVRLELDPLAEGSPLRWGRGSEEANSYAEPRGPGSTSPIAEVDTSPHG